MANKQYIGARYVPAFFDNNGSNEWAAGVAYEPLTIVTYLGNSYTSKKPVPSNIGAPNTTEGRKYWVNTGNQSAAVDEVRTIAENAETKADEAKTALKAEEAARKKEDQALSERIEVAGFITSRLSGKKLLVIGDSLTTDSEGNVSWCTKLGEKYGVTVYNYSVSGSPYANGKTGAASIYSRTPAALQAHSEVDYIIFSGGANDMGKDIPIGASSSSSRDTMVGAIKGCIQLARDAFPKAKLAVMGVYNRNGNGSGQFSKNALGYELRDYANAIRNICTMYSVPYFDNYADSGINLANAVLRQWQDNYLARGEDSPNYHFSSEAASFLMEQYAAWIAGGFGSVSLPSTTESRVGIIKFPDGTMIETTKYDIGNVQMEQIGNSGIYRSVNTYQLTYDAELSAYPMSVNLYAKTNQNAWIGAGIGNPSKSKSAPFRFFSDSATVTGAYVWATIIGAWI